VKRFVAAEPESLHLQRANVLQMEKGFFRRRKRAGEIESLTEVSKKLFALSAKTPEVTLEEREVHETRVQ